MPPDTENSRIMALTDAELFAIWRGGVERARRYLDATDQPYPKHLQAAIEYLETGCSNESLLKKALPAKLPDAQPTEGS